MDPCDWKLDTHYQIVSRTPRKKKKWAELLDYHILTVIAKAEDILIDIILIIYRWLITLLSDYYGTIYRWLIASHGYQIEQSGFWITHRFFFKKKRKNKLLVSSQTTGWMNSRIPGQSSPRTTTRWSGKWHQLDPKPSQFPPIRLRLNHNDSFFRTLDGCVRHWLKQNDSRMLKLIDWNLSDDPWSQFDKKNTTTKKSSGTMLTDPSDRTKLLVSLNFPQKKQITEEHRSDCKMVD